MNPLDPKIIEKLARGGMPIQEFETWAGSDLEIEILKASGMNLIIDNDRYRFESAILPLDEAVYCIVDIETNGSKPSQHQIIEIGAIKVQSGSVIDTYETLVYCTEISEQIQAITGITPDLTRDAPALTKVMREFRVFLGDAIFVGHDAKFDYSFISSMMERVGLSRLLNRSLCTIDLAERTIQSERYGLAYLNSQLQLYKDATHHRAFSDAMTTTKLLKRTLKLLPSTIHTVEEVIAFSKEAKRLKKPKTVVENKQESKAENIKKES